MKKRSAICLIVDGLRASALGAYGNTTFPTPFLDDFASRSKVADWFFVDSLELNSFYRGAWHGRHALRPKSPDPCQGLPMLLRQAGVRQWLASDDPWLSRESVNFSFNENLLIEPPAHSLAKSIEDTCQAQFFSELILRLNEWQLDMSEEDSGSLLWIHSRGLMAPWDSPSDLREKFMEEEVPMPKKSVDSFESTVGLEDPDILHGYRVAYAAQVAVLDACLGAFFDNIEEEFAGEELLIMLLGSRGYGLGEHGFIGVDPNQLFGECLHVPWLTHIGGVQEPPQRDSTIAMPADVGATLLHWFDQKSTVLGDGKSLLNESSQESQVSVSKAENGSRSVRTPAWFLREASDASGSRLLELYAKPDDRWEYNDVASRCSDVVEDLKDELGRFATAASGEAALPRKLTIPELAQPNT